MDDVGKVNYRKLLFQLVFVGFSEEFHRHFVVVKHSLTAINSIIDSSMLNETHPVQAAS